MTILVLNVYVKEKRDMENSYSSFTFPGKVHKPSMRIKLLIIGKLHNALHVT